VVEKYQDAFEEAIKDLAETMRHRERNERERDWLDTKILKLREGVLGLGSLCGKTQTTILRDNPELFPNLIDPDVGLTDAVRQVLKESHKHFLTPVRIGEKLKTIGYDVSNQKNLLASLHTILKRLKKQGEAMTGTRDGKTVYKWKGPPPSENEAADHKRLTRRQQRQADEDEKIARLDESESVD
jgi:hypothetical protein